VSDREAAAGAAECGKLRWHCRRGMRELDVLLTNYLDTRYRQAPGAEQEAFRELLDAPDALILGLFLGTHAAPSAAMSALIARISAPPRDAV